MMIMLTVSLSLSLSISVVGWALLGSGVVLREYLVSVGWFWVLLSYSLTCFLPIGARRAVCPT
jgi:hypothetical protein